MILLIGKRMKTAGVKRNIRGIKGWTLIELLLVLLILSIWMSLQAPALARRIGDFELREFAARFSKHLSFVQKQAIITSDYYLVENDNEKKRVRTFVRDKADEKGEFKPVSGSWGNWKYGHELSIKGAQGPYLYGPRGASAVAGDIRITHKKDCVSVSVDGTLNGPCLKAS